MKVKPLGRDFELNYDDSRHKYDLDSRLLHGASTIAGMVGETQWMIPWASGAVAKEADKVLDELGTDEILRKEYFRRIRWAHKAVSQGALDIGNSVHEWAEKFVNFKMGKLRWHQRHPFYQGWRTLHWRLQDDQELQGQVGETRNGFSVRIVWSCGRAVIKHDR